MRSHSIAGSFILFLLSSVLLTGQGSTRNHVLDIYPIENGSFNHFIPDMGVYAAQLSGLHVVDGWECCKDRLENCPIIMSTRLPNFEIEQLSSINDRILVLVTRENETCTGLTQYMKKTLRANHTYRVTLALARSEEMKSQVRRGMKISSGAVPFNEPIILGIYGAEYDCEPDEILVWSPVIYHTNWKDYTLEFTPEFDVDWIHIAAHKSHNASFWRNGNILIDWISDIELIEK